MGLFDQKFKIGFKGKLYQNLADPGSMLFGGAGVSNSLGMERDGDKSGLMGDQAQGIDWFGSPVTAGTNLQGGARLGAILYGAAAGAGAAGAGGAGGGAGGGTAAGGAAPSAGAPIVDGAASGGSATAGGSAGSSAPAWSRWLRMAPKGGGGGQQYQPTWTTFDDSEKQAERELLARMLMEGRYA